MTMDLHSGLVYPHSGCVDGGGRAGGPLINMGP